MHEVSRKSNDSQMGFCLAQLIITRCLVIHVGWGVNSKFKQLLGQVFRPKSIHLGISVYLCCHTHNMFLLVTINTYLVTHLATIITSFTIISSLAKYIYMYIYIYIVTHSTTTKTTMSPHEFHYKLVYRHYKYIYIYISQ